MFSHFMQFPGFFRHLQSFTVISSLFSLSIKFMPCPASTNHFQPFPGISIHLRYSRYSRYQPFPTLSRYFKPFQVFQVFPAISSNSQPFPAISNSKKLNNFQQTRAIIQLFQHMHITSFCSLTIPRPWLHN